MRRLSDGHAGGFPDFKTASVFDAVYRYAVRYPRPVSLFSYPDDFCFLFAYQFGRLVGPAVLEDDAPDLLGCVLWAGGVDPADVFRPCC